jgi:hypothetical protein
MKALTVSSGSTGIRDSLQGQALSSTKSCGQIVPRVIALIDLC